MKKIFFYSFLILSILTVFLWAIIHRLNEKPVKEKYPITVPELYSYTHENTVRYKTSKEFIFDVFIPHKFCGIISGKNINRMDHDSHNFVIITKDYFFELYTEPDFEGVDSGLFEYSCIGDSIFKKSYSLIISVKRGNIIKNFKVTPYEAFWINPYYNESRK
jgi:hypothetical protein